MDTKLDTGRVFERIFQIYGDQFTLLIPAALVLFLPVAILNGFLLESGGILVGLATTAIALIATYWYQGMVVEAVVDILDGRRDHTVGSLFSSASPFIGRLIGAGILATLIIIDRAHPDHRARPDRAHFPRRGRARGRDRPARRDRRAEAQPRARLGERAGACSA